MFFRLDFRLPFCWNFGVRYNDPVSSQKDWQSWKDLMNLCLLQCVFDTLKYFKGDKPAAEFEAGTSCGGNFPCVGCVCSSRFTDFVHATSCEQRSLRWDQEVALC